MQPFWLDPSDPHRMASVMQLADPAALTTTTRSPPATGGTSSVDQELVWAKAIHRVATEGISPEQAVDEAIARIKQILSE